ncbi:Uncharacterised protein [Bartonella grahamii]|uniref:Uncharacterized protein n=1 Tax=Bartonella grahamii TaxID=33045 RepID=A0A336NCT7_BARGR|nr:Uncharacterised protein [Bartonella grahamii]
MAKKFSKKIPKMTKGAVSHSFVPISPFGEAATITDAVYADIYTLIFFKSQWCKRGKCLSIRAMTL